MVIIDNNIEEDTLELYLNGKYEGKITNLLAFYDVRRQIKRLHLKGYSVKFDHQMYEISTKGQVCYNGRSMTFYSKIDEYLEELTTWDD